MAFFAIATVLIWVAVFASGFGLRRVRGVVAKLRRLLATALLACVGLLLTICLIVLQSLQMFAGETLVARVRTESLGADEFELAYMPVGRTASETVRAHLQGNQWSITGGIVKWHPWVGALGVKSYHKPLRLAGQYADLMKQRGATPTIHPLHASMDQVWEALYWATPYLPFIDAAYLSSAAVYVEPSVTYDVYVTSTGYLIKRHQTSDL